MTGMTEINDAGSRWRVLWGLGLVIVLMLVLPVAARAQATPGASPVAAGPYAEEFERARQQATSDFERRVLADDVITPDEYEQAIERFVSCIRDAGQEVELIPDEHVPGLQNFMFAYEEDDSMDDALFDDLFVRCSTGTIMIISSLYWSFLVNPDNEDLNELMATCLRREGLVDGDFSGQDFVDAMMSESWAFPFAEADPAFMLCVNNPTQAGLSLATPVSPGTTSGMSEGVEPVASPAASPVAAHPYTAEFERARQRAVSDFELEVLADDIITAEEYQQAVDLMLGCMQAEGIDLQAEPSPDIPGMYVYFYTLPDDVDPASAEGQDLFERQMDVNFECSQGTTYQIEALYRSVLVNPDNLDYDVLIVECLKATGLADADYTVEEFVANFAVPDGTFPFEEFDPRFGSCINNATQTGLPT